MCSVLGCFDPRVSVDEINILNNHLSHRGPDNATLKEYSFRNKKLFLAHNRLSVQDLHASANQPMEHERYVIVFNGEIYNHMELRNECVYKWKTHSDTETLLVMFHQLGIEKSIEKLIGMFAIVLFDKKEERLYLIRDRVGIKPLYWSFQNGEFAFASELKGIPEHLKKSVSNKSLIQFMSLGYTPEENSYYENVYKLPPAHILVFDGEHIQRKRYWDLPSNTLRISYKDALDQTEELIRSAVRYRLLSDLEVGSFLSGGVDSSLVSTIMQQEASQKIKTFSIGFDDPRYDESVFAKEVARHIQSEHYEYKFTAKDVLRLVEKIDYHFDEPFGDASALPMMLLSQKTKQHVTVALSGDGGDELFMGYERYFLTQQYFKKFNRLPQSVRTVLAYLLKCSGQDKFEKISYPLRHLSSENLYAVLYSAVKPWELNDIFSKEFVYEAFGKEQVGLTDLLGMAVDDRDLMDGLSRLDFNRYLPDDILTKVDRSSMAYSLEARVPLLDHRLVELAYSLPTQLKLQNGPKSILKDILYRHVPRELIERPKRGFSVPLKHWFKNELKDVLMDKVESLDERFNKPYIDKLIRSHLHKNRNYEYVFWNLMRVK